MRLTPLRDDLRVFLARRKLLKKWDKAAALFTSNPSHPSLNLELLEPHWRGVYSFRIDRKYRASFFFVVPGVAEVVVITNHYKK
jgi:plasmid maintenance system killer protein